MSFNHKLWFSAFDGWDKEPCWGEVGLMGHTNDGRKIYGVDLFTQAYDDESESMYDDVIGGFNIVEGETFKGTTVYEAIRKCVGDKIGELRIKSEDKDLHLVTIVTPYNAFVCSAYDSQYKLIQRGIYIDREGDGFTGYIVEYTYDDGTPCPLETIEEHKENCTDIEFFGSKFFGIQAHRMVIKDTDLFSLLDQIGAVLKFIYL